MPPKKTTSNQPQKNKLFSGLQQQLTAFVTPRAWVKVTSPHSLAWDAFRSWRSTAVDAGATHLGHRIDELAQAGGNLNAYISLYICFSSTRSAEQWRDTACVRDTPFASETIRGRQPNEAHDWRNGLPLLDPQGIPSFASEPQAVVSLTSVDESSEPAGWVDALELLGIPALLNTAESSVWIPVWDSAAGENLRLRLLGTPDFQQAVVRVFQKNAFKPGRVNCKVTLVPPSTGSVRRLLQQEHTIFRHHLDRLFHADYITLDHEDHVHFRKMRTSVAFKSLSSTFRCILAHGTHKRATHRLRWSVDAAFLLPSPSQPPTTPPQSLASPLQEQSPRRFAYLNKSTKENEDPSSPDPPAKRRKLNLAADAVASAGKLFGSLTRRAPSSPITIQSSPRRPPSSSDSNPQVPPHRPAPLSATTDRKGKGKAAPSHKDDANTLGLFSEPKSHPFPTIELSSSPPRPPRQEGSTRADQRVSKRPASPPETSQRPAKKGKPEAKEPEAQSHHASTSATPIIELSSSPPRPPRQEGSTRAYQRVSKRPASPPEPSPRPAKKGKLQTKEPEQKKPVPEAKADATSSSSKADWCRIRIPTDPSKIVLLSPEQENEARPEILPAIHEWHDSHKCEPPAEDEINAIIGKILASPHVIAVFYRARRSQATTLELITAILELKEEIGAATPTVYVCAVHVPKERIRDVVDRLKNVHGHERERIITAMQNVYLDLCKKGYTDDYIVSFLYAGYTWMLSRRASLDVLHYSHEGSAMGDKRSPFIVTGTVGGGAMDIHSTGFVELADGEAWINGHRNVIAGPNGEFKAFPIVTRIPVFDILATPPHLRHLLEAILAALLLPNNLNVQLGGLMRHRLDAEMVAKVKAADFPPNVFEQILFIGDATGKRGRAFPESETGVLIKVMVTDYTANPDPVFRMPDWHFDIGHESNDGVVTKEEINVMKASITPDDLVIVSFGSRVAEKNTRRHLVTADILPKKTRFFEGSILSILDVERVHFPFPHCGVLNYVGHQEWIKDAFADSLPMLLLFANESAKLKEQGLGRHPEAARMLMTNCEAHGLFSFASKRLVGPGMRNLWDGAIVSAVGRHREAGEAWSTVYEKVVEENDRKLITTLEKPLDDCMESRNLCCILKLPDDGSGGEISRQIVVPDAGTIIDLRIPKAWRGKKDFLGTLYLHPTTLHLQMVSSSGDMLFHPQEGRLFSIPRTHWLTTKTYAPEALEAHARKQGLWTELSTLDKVEVSYRKSRAEEQSRREQKSRAKGENSEGSTCNANLRLVTTLEEKEIIDGVAKGEFHLHPLSASYKFKFWNGDKCDFEPVHKRDCWTPLDFKGGLPKGIEWVAPFVDRRSKAWGLLLFECNESSGWAPRFVRRAGMCPPMAGRKLFPVIHGPKTWLYKKQFGS